MNDPNVIPYMFWIVIVGIGTCFCCDRFICKPIIKKLKNNHEFLIRAHIVKDVEKIKIDRLFIIANDS